MAHKAKANGGGPLVRMTYGLLTQRMKKGHAVFRSLMTVIPDGGLNPAFSTYRLKGGEIVAMGQLTPTSVAWLWQIYCVLMQQRLCSIRLSNDHYSRQAMCQEALQRCFPNQSTLLRAANLSVRPLIARSICLTSFPNLVPTIQSFESTRAVPDKVSDDATSTLSVSDSTCQNPSLQAWRRMSCAIMTKQLLKLAENSKIQEPCISRKTPPAAAIPSGITHRTIRVSLHPPAKLT